MNSKATSFFKNFSYALSSNLISLLVSILIILIVPKLIGVDDYGYWQLYLFYTSFIGFMHFGWNDGIYLRYGGRTYEELNKQLFFTQLYMLFASQLIIGIIIYFIAHLILSDGNRTFIIQMTAVCLLITNVRYMFLFVLQATNRIKEYAQIVTIDRMSYIFLVIFLLIAGINNFKLLIIADLVGRFISLIISMYHCRDFVFQKLTSFYFSFHEAFKNISVGIKLMFANLASTMIIGTVRFGIERNWDVATFGKVSLTLSLAKFMMVFINALGIIMFPILRRSDKNKLAGLYISLRDFLMIILLATLIAYYPIKLALSAWLPQYSDGLIYLALLFPMCVFEGKMALVVNTYLKTLRKEKLMLIINLISLFLSIIVTSVTTIVFKNLDLAVLSIVVLLAFRSVLAEILISKMLNISLYKDIILELTMILVFIITGWLINSWLTVLLYIFAYILYLLLKRRDLYKTFANIKLLLKS